MQKLHAFLLAVLGTAFAYLLIIPVWLAYFCGRVSIHWTEGAQEALRKGRVLLVANHPSLIETVVLPALFWHPAWLKESKRTPWSVADRQLFGDRPWIYKAFRCIEVSREGGSGARRINIRAINNVLKRLKDGGVVLFYPEGGRTCRGLIKYTCADRYLRECKVGLINQAMFHGCNVIPIWISHGTVTEPETFFRGYIKLFFGPKFHIYFGKQVSSKHIAEDGIAAAILGAGT